MSATQNELAELSRYVFRAPSWYTSVGFALLIAAVTGVAAFGTVPVESSWDGLLFVGRDALEGVFFVGVPTVVAGLGTAAVDRATGGKLTPNRSSLLALVCELVVVVLLTGAAVAVVLTPLGRRFVFDTLIVALASVFALRLLVITAVSRSSLLVAAIPASIQTLASAVLLFVYSGTLRYLELGQASVMRAYLLPYLARPEQAPPELLAIGPSYFGMLGLLCGLYALAVYGFLTVIDRPWRRTLGVSGLDFVRGFIGHVAEGTRELEDFFEQLGEEAVVPVTVLAFRREDGSEKARFVLPMVHPGPMGEIGGGNLPERVAETAEGLAFPPHATAGHDFNIVTEREVDEVLRAAERAHGRISYGPTASPGVRTTAGESTMLGQAFGDAALLVATYAPGFADDVDYGVGLAAAKEARAAGLDDVMLADAHNCNNGLDAPAIGHVTPGSQRSFDMMAAAREAGGGLAAAERGPLELGAAWDPTPWEPAQGIGPLGVRVAVTRVEGQTTAYVLVDGNNMDPGLRDRIVDAIEGEAAADAPAAGAEPLVADGPPGDGPGPTVDVAEVMTTDTHVVNTMEAENQVGAAIDDDRLLALVWDLLDEALADLEPVTAGMATERTTVTVFGNDRTETLASHANAVVAMGGAFAAAVVLAAVAVSALIFFLA